MLETISEAQCGIGSISSRIPMPLPCMFLDSINQQAQHVTNPYTFTTGWFHSTFVSNDQKRLYFAGKSITENIPSHAVGAFILKPIDCVGSIITFVGSGDHEFLVVYDNNLIVYGQLRYDILKETK